MALGEGQCVQSRQKLSARSSAGRLEGGQPWRPKKPALRWSCGQMPGAGALLPSEEDTRGPDVAEARPGALRWVSVRGRAHGNFQGPG